MNTSWLQRVKCADSNPHLRVKKPRSHALKKTLPGLYSLLVVTYLKYQHEYCICNNWSTPSTSLPWHQPVFSMCFATGFLPHFTPSSFHFQILCFPSQLASDHSNTAEWRAKPPGQAVRCGQCAPPDGCRFRCHSENHRWRPNSPWERLIVDQIQLSCLNLTARVTISDSLELSLCGLTYLTASFKMFSDNDG